MKNIKTIAITLILAALAVIGTAPFVIYPGGGGGGTGDTTTTMTAGF